MQDIFGQLINYFFITLLTQIIDYFRNILVSISSTAIDILTLDIVKKAVGYAQSLAMVLLIIKSGTEAFQTYILHQNGDPDADPTGLLIRTGQAVAVIMCLPWIVEQLFTFGIKVTRDISGVAVGSPQESDFVRFLSSVNFNNSSISIVLLFLLFVILMLIVAMQMTIRGAELALLSIIGPILALNITANNRSLWSAWFRQLIAISLTQALQIFMLTGALTLFLAQPISSNAFIWGFGWIWVTLKCPKFIQQFVHSTGLSGAVSGTAKQAGSIAITRMMILRK